MTQEKTRRITLRLSPERSKEIRARVAAAACPKVTIKLVEEHLTRTAELTDVEDLIAGLLEEYYTSAGFKLVRLVDRDPDYNHEAAEPLTAEPEPEGMEGTA